MSYYDNLFIANFDVVSLLTNIPANVTIKLILDRFYNTYDQNQDSRGNNSIEVETFVLRKTLCL